MLPSLVARDILTSLKQFLVAAFDPADDFMHGLMQRFVADEAAWLKGPYVQIGLPFVSGEAGKGFFAGFTTPVPAYSHQELAWRRLSTLHEAVSALVATGTGSGKSECFLYPVLDHCARARAAEEAGIKALVIYPMNALASDQARRIAELVATVPAFAGLRVGLYVGGNAQANGGGLVMTATGVITDRATLRQQPPDLLLTNYKMLDYLMLRPKDRELWSGNTPTTLRYVVVDELHTFDGAQGTDLALLLRRLRARLRVPQGQLICVGTSATLGDASNTAPLREYARQIFGQEFPAAAVITERRQSVAEFLGDATVDFMFAFRPDLAGVLEPERYRSPEAAVAAWFGLFFPEEPFPAAVRDPAWRVELGQLLKRHQLFVNLLKLLKGGVVDYGHLTAAFARNLAAASPAQIGQVLDALLVLVAWARGEGDQPQGNQPQRHPPLVTLRLQLWVRELRRMVARVATDPATVRLRHSRDLPAARDGLYLPLVQCGQCRTTGWLSRLVQGSQKLSTDLDEIYNTWFGRRPEAARLYPAASIRRSQVGGQEEHLCVACGTVQPTGKACQACGQEDLLPVFRVTALRERQRDGLPTVHCDTTCPACGEQRDLLLLGARNATLGSQVVEASWASVFNDDKKLLAFSDAVQDAAHRAGFFGARTWITNVRTALAQAIDELEARAEMSPLTWSRFLTEAEALFDRPSSVLHLDPERLVTEFIGPNMTWQRDWAVELLQHNHLPAASRLPARVKKRLLWQAVSDLTYLSQRGRTLERIGKAALAVPWARVDAVAARLLPVLHEQFGARGLEQPVLAQWLWGLLTHLRRRGAVMHPELTHYAGDGNVYALTHTAGRGEWLPMMGYFTPQPVFLTLGKQRDFDKLSASGRSTWYPRWALAVLGRQMLVDKDLAIELYHQALTALRAADLLLLTPHPQGDTLALNPDALVLETRLAYLATAGGERRLTVPQADAGFLLGMPCLDAVETHYARVIPDAAGWWARRYSQGDLRRVIAGEHTGLLARGEREALEGRFKAKDPKPWYENLLSATPTLEMGVDIGDLSSVLLCSVPPNQASFLQRMGRAGRRDGNALTTTLADENSPHDLYFFASTEEMIAGEVVPPGIFLQAAEVLRRQLFAFCMDDWVASLAKPTALPERTSPALDALEQVKQDRFPYLLHHHILAHEERLFTGFTDLLGSDLHPAVRDRLWDYLQGQGEVDGLRARLMKALEELVEERRVYKKRREELDRAKTRLQRQPQDEATQEEIEQLKRERDKLLELIREIDNRDLLNTLTDAGLLPNYAFPEAGVELKSVLWRKRAEDEPGQGAYVTLDTLRYERPAQSALSEFAPENRFYANQRRVEIDQINMSLAKTEEWRLCPACHHMQNLAIQPDLHLTCPRCGDGMWADTAQKRTLLRFRQAIANSDDTKVRIDDSAEDREPKYYVRQLLADFDPDQVREAWRIGGGDPPFGFEFIARVTFRDVNFGELAKPGQSFRVAAQESARPGFKLCKYCGKVQGPARPNGESEAQTHSFDCPRHGSTDPLNLLECLYLYREFESEALRILVPHTRTGVDERVVQSFMAALQLGLKRRFGGKVDHLRLILQDEPGQEGGQRKYFVLLYDSVPGGTGYLHQLLAQDAGTLTEVLTLALATLTQCPCNQDSDKDGCYSCLYQYRLGRHMEQVSRDTAKALLGELVAALPRLERVATLSDIYINPNFDSVLESRFIEGLQRLGGKAGLPLVKLVQDLVNGKSGYVLAVDQQRYRIEPQCPLGPDQGVTVPSKPDFVIWPWAAGSRRRPVAVFCDGWTYHRDSLREDAHKRSALLASGKFWVWSVTHPDVASALEGNPQTDLESPLTALSRHEGRRIPPGDRQALDQALTQHGVAGLLRWLALPPEAQGQEGALDSAASRLKTSSRSDNPGQDATLFPLQRNALWLGYLLVPATPADAAAAKQELACWLPRLPAPVREPGKGFAPSLSRPGGAYTQVGWWPLALAREAPSGPRAATAPLPPLVLDLAGANPWTAPGMLILDEAAALDEEALHGAWRHWLHLFNLMQFLPGQLLATATGLDGDDYAGLVRAEAASPPAQAADQAALNAIWLEALDQVLSPLQPGLRQLARAGAALPEVGMELTDAQGRVLADAELAWPATRLAVLRPDQEDLAPNWLAADWQVLSLDGGHCLVEGRPWALVVADRLDLTLNPTA